MCGSVILFLAAVASVGVTLYYGALLTGWFKDPLMAQFRVYGEERKVYPLPFFLRALGVCCLLMAVLLSGIAFAAPTLVIVGLLALVAEAIIERDPRLRLLLPRWYAILFQDTTREERRALAFAWLRMGLRARLRLNGDQYAFRVWTDEVRLTVIYGARDPDDPWAIWQ